MSILVVQTSLPTKKQAEDLAEIIIQNKMAACAQISGPITSIYHWDNKINKEEEWLCSFKTRPELYPTLENAIIKSHPYQTPEIIANLTSHQNLDYRDWVTKNVK